MTKKYYTDAHGVRHEICRGSMGARGWFSRPVGGNGKWSPEENQGFRTKKVLCAVLDADLEGMGRAAYDAAPAHRDSKGRIVGRRVYA
jgi:hypothetical protein